MRFVLQEAHLRFSEHRDQVHYPKRWLEQVVTRLCLDQLKSARAQREEYVGQWLPEPLETEGATLLRLPVDSESIWRSWALSSPPCSRVT